MIIQGVSEQVVQLRKSVKEKEQNFLITAFVFERI